MFCSYEVGGLPYKMAETFNRHGIEAYYISLDRDARGHDSTKFHYGDRQDLWNLSSLFDKDYQNDQKIINLLIDIKSRYSIKYCLATGHRSYLLDKAKIDYAYWCYGTDFDQFCKSPVFKPEYSIWKKAKVGISFLLNFFKEQKRLIPPNYPLWKKTITYFYILFRLSKEQRRSIIKASSLMISSHQLNDYQKLCPGKSLFFIPHLINVTGYDELCGKKTDSKVDISKAIGAKRFFFSSTRHLWSSKNKLFRDYKGNDVILRSFKRYLEISGDDASKLVLVKKGPDTGQSEMLIQELGIDKHVVWLNEMKRDDIRVYYQGASVCFGQFGTPLLNYAVLEPLSNASPTVSFVGDYDDSVPFYSTPPPIFNTMDPEKIANFIHRITSDTGYASEVSYNSWFWAKENCSEERFTKDFLEISKPEVF